MAESLLIRVGSTNPIKIEAVKEAKAKSALLASYAIESCTSPSEVSDQPMTFEETVKGAKNRAKNAYLSCRYSIGIESGLMHAPGTNTGMIEFCACAIYDGSNYGLGVSCGFELPPKVLSLITQHKMELSEAYYLAGLTQNRKLGAGEGALGLLTRMQVTRKDYTVQAVQMALIQFENSEIYFARECGSR
jgi:inosine/xanthosine triphosphatase